jgi:hypothetical protein
MFNEFDENRIFCDFGNGKKSIEVVALGRFVGFGVSHDMQLLLS